MWQAGMLAAIGSQPRWKGINMALSRYGARQAAATLRSGLFTSRRESAAGGLGYVARLKVPRTDHKRASIVELTDSGKALADQVKQLWCALAEETVTGLPAQTVAELPRILKTLTSNVDTRRPRHPHGRRDGEQGWSTR
jgi:hypothetical protein